MFFCDYFQAHTEFECTITIPTVRAVWTNYEKFSNGYVSWLMILPHRIQLTIHELYFRQIQDPASQRLTWYKPPLAVLVIKKVRDSTVLSPFIQLVEWLIEEKHMVVWVESAVLDDPVLMEDKKFLGVKDKLVTFK